MNNSNNNNRDETVILKDFYGPGRDIRQSDLGWQMEQKREAQSLVSKVIFNYEIVRIGPSTISTTTPSMVFTARDTLSR